ncbi:MAG: hypothetical protein NTY65_04190 [Planctomycetota bacterium]|nr:hypothetical protein [Planctomycetota bacterium]
MLEQLRETARGVQSTFREAALLAEIEKLREAIEATEQTLAMQKHRLELLAKELQKEPGHLAKLAGTDAGATLVGVIRGLAGQPQHPAAPQQPPPAISARQPQSGSARLSAPQLIKVQQQRAAVAFAQAAPVQAAPVRPAPAAETTPAAETVEEKPPAAPPAHEAAETEVTHEAAATPPPAPAVEAGPQDEFDAHERLLVNAIDTGCHALADLDQTITEVQDLARAGVWRIVKGMVSSHSPEYAKIEEVRSHAHEVQELLGSFEHQVRGLHDQFGHRVDAADLAGFAKRFAEALAAGPHEEHLGHQATEAARAAYHDVRRMCARLQLDAIALRAERAAARRSGRRQRMGV